MIRFTRTTCLIALIGFSGFVFACGSGSSGGGTGGAAGTGTGNNGGSNNSNGGSSNNGGSNSSNGGSNSNNGGSNSSNGGTSAGCDPATDPTGMGDDCIPYSECMQENCASEYEGCLGANYQDGDFSGGSCEMFMNCMVDCDCDEACTQDCELDSACQNCFIGLAFSSCGSQNCGDELNTCAGTQGAGGSSNTGGSGGTGGIPGLSDATCADLATCCPTLDANTQPSCDAIVGQGVDLLCAASFTGLGCE
ncbi:MAG TPA: hypothetical protein VHO25_20820 [Polyangiaceae bacterium]|nr:hypothetical protein [Polyangiaceae bacterium]